MHARTCAAHLRPLPTTHNNGGPTSTPASSARPSSSASSLPNPSQASLRRSNNTNNNSSSSARGGGLALLSEDVLASSLPAAPGSAFVHTPTLVTLPNRSGNSRSSSSSHTTLDVVHMPVLPSAATTPTARRSTPSPSQPQRVTSRGSRASPHHSDTTETTTASMAGGVSTASAPPARLRRFSNPPRPAETPMTEGGLHTRGCEGEAEGREDGVDQRTRRRSSGSSSRLPAMLQPSKLASAPTATLPSSVLTSPARMASQPDIHVLSVTSPARRGCLSGGSVGGTVEEEHVSGNGSTGRTFGSTTATTSAQSSTPPVALAGGRSAVAKSVTNASSGNRGGTSETWEGHTESLQIPSPPPPPAASAGSASRCTIPDSARRRTASPDLETTGTNTSGEAYLREHPRVRSLVNTLYQHVVTVQPENPLQYLAYCSPQALTTTPTPAEPTAVMGERTDSNASDGAPMTLATTATTTTTTTTTTITTTDTRRGSEGSELGDAQAPASTSDSVSQQQQQLRSPLGRAGRLVTPRTVHLANTTTTTTINANSSSSGHATPAVVSARGRSSPVQTRQGRRGSLDSGLSLASTANIADAFPQTSRGVAGGSGGANTRSSCAMTAPTHPIGLGGGNNVSGTGSNNNNHHATATTSTTSISGASGGNRGARAPPPSAPSPSLVTRMTSAGSPANLTSLRSTLGSARLGSPFHPQRQGLQSGHGVGSAAASFANGIHRALPHQPSFAGSLTGVERGEATPSDNGSLFSTNSVDLQEFIAEFRMAKEECSGGGIESPMITLEDLAAILETVSFPFPDAAALMDLFDELQPCARYLINATAAAATTAVPMLQFSTSSSQTRRQRESTGAAESGPLRGSTSVSSSNHLSNSHDTYPTQAHVSLLGRSGVESCITAAELHHPYSSAAATEGRSADVGVDAMQHDGSDDAVEGRRAEGSRAGDTVAAAAGALPNGRKDSTLKPHPSSRSMAADGYFTPSSIPIPPPSRPIPHDAEDTTTTIVNTSTSAPVVPFDTFVARMAFKIQGRYSAEAVRMAFYGMMVDEEINASVAPTTVLGGAHELASTSSSVCGRVFDGFGPRSLPTTAPGLASRGMSNVFSTDSLAPSEPMGTGSMLTTMNEAGMPSCTVPLPRCLSEGLYARLGMVDLTAADVQRGVRHAGLPTASEDQLACECHLEDFTRLVRAVTTVADRGFSVSPGNFCLSSLRDSTLQRGPSSATSWKEEPAAAVSGRISNVPSAHTIRYM